jgi:heme/copper-type cytochrome/quinol oxidase subunit 2
LCVRTLAMMLVVVVVVMLVIIVILMVCRTTRQTSCADGHFVNQELHFTPCVAPVGWWHVPCRLIALIGRECYQVYTDTVAASGRPPSASVCCLATRRWSYKSHLYSLAVRQRFLQRFWFMDLSDRLGGYRRASFR